MDYVKLHQNLVMQLWIDYLKLWSMFDDAVQQNNSQHIDVSIDFAQRNFFNTYTTPNHMHELFWDHFFWLHATNYCGRLLTTNHEVL